MKICKNFCENNKSYVCCYDCNYKQCDKSYQCSAFKNKIQYIMCESKPDIKTND